MEVIDFIKHPIAQSCIEKSLANLPKKEEVKYNLFTLSSYNNERENFHSDVIASLLDVKGLHKEDNKFLELFIAYLNKHYTFAINFDDFKNAETHLEVGDGESRLDIIILGSAKSIIIENKMNGAPDMEKQIDRYYTFSKKKGYDVSAIVYITLEGVKNAPTPDIPEAALVLRNIGAFDDSKKDFVSGWLTPCLKECSNEDSRSLIHQYIKLLKHTSNTSMDNQIIEELYQFIGNPQGIKAADTLVELVSKMPEYRTNRFVKAIQNFKPFRYTGRYKSNYHLYDGYKDGENTYKLDIAFERDGTAFIWFWLPAKTDESGQEIILKKLQDISMDNEFEKRNTNGYMKFFKLNEGYATLALLDDAVISFVKLFTERLRTTNA